MITYILALVITTQNLLYAPETYRAPEPQQFSDEYSYQVAAERFAHHGNWNTPVIEGAEGYPFMTWEQAAAEAGRMADEFNPEVDDVEFSHWN